MAVVTRVVFCPGWFSVPVPPAAVGGFGISLVPFFSMQYFNSLVLATVQKWERKRSLAILSNSMYFQY
jgi:hypothetical protein